ncbi:hypothetical protein A4D02_27935 [Niastella koreensis]|uniref:Uncharacterized protein n=2 Tax=Niastella koreensis TaxID=354356 RepID=G8TJC5_NIAKG|nr:hypothetical protein [Niastella koreensis]AEV99660.1 hypothetical protein Niako_3350 [Niastella koreensis GR20-10]OQP49909.1 hypothetical protein A4D02_27935 [Niastella koreensis]
MGQIVHAFIEHRLTPEEILNLPDYLQSVSANTLAGLWHWTTSGMNKLTLADLWTRKAEYFINNSWSEQDLALLEKDNLTLHFSSPHLVTFDNSLRWDTYHRNEELRKGFNCLSKAISSLLNAVDILIVPDLSSIDFYDENLTVDAYRQKANGNELYAIELDLMRLT